MQCPILYTNGDTGEVVRMSRKDYRDMLRTRKLVDAIFEAQMKRLDAELCKKLHKIIIDRRKA